MMKKYGRLNAQLKSYHFICSAMLMLFLISMNFCLFMNGISSQLTGFSRTVDQSNLPGAFQAFILYDSAPLYGVYRMLFPLLAVMPGAYIYLKERQSGEKNYLILRMGRNNYFFSCLIYAMLIPFCLITGFLLFSAFLNRVFLPDYGWTEYGYLHFYLNNLRANAMLLPEVFVYSPFLSTICSSIMAGIFASLLSGITLVISFFLPRIEYAQVIILLPVFLLSFLLDIVSNIIGRTRGRSPALNPVQFVTISLYPYYKSMVCMLGLMGVMVCFIAAGMIVRRHRDEI